MWLNPAFIDLLLEKHFWSGLIYATVMFSGNLVYKFNETNPVKKKTIQQDFIIAITERPVSKYHYGTAKKR